MEETSFLRRRDPIHDSADVRSRLRTKLRAKNLQKEEEEASIDTATLSTWEDFPHVHDTTYYKAVPFTRIRLDNQLKKTIESLKKYPDYKKCIEYRSRKHEYFELLKIAGSRRPRPIPAGPVLYVKSIAICNDKQGWNDFKMFGEISITDSKKNTFYFFNVGPDDYHRVSSEWNLFFCYSPMAPVSGGNLKFSLRNPKGDPQIFKEDREFSIHYLCKDDCEDDIHQEFPLEGGYYAKMIFNKIPRAALVRCELFLRYTGSTVGVDNNGFYTVHGSLKINDVVCVKESKILCMRYGKDSGFDQWSRSVFAVPVGSPLKVEYKLNHDKSEFANGKCEVPPNYILKQGGLGDEVYLPCNDKNYCLGLSVKWYVHPEFFDPRRDSMRDIDVKRNVPHQKSLQETSDFDLVEVFSVVVRGADSAPPVLCGRIVVGDEHGQVYIFARNKDFPDKYSSTKRRLERTVSLAWPDRWLLNKNFYMHLRLKDANDDLVCDGELNWIFPGDVRYDRRLCDVITHENGFLAAVHYSVFSNGKKAKVSVKHNEDDGYSHVYGSVFAAYDNNDDWISSYDKECYRSIIFNRSKEDCVTVKNCFEIPLSKTHVSTPSDCKVLIVDADLWVRHNTTSSYQRATAELHFEACRNGSQSKQLGCLAVTVEWS